MLIRFQFENFTSFRDQQELSLVASSSLHGKADRSIPVPSSTEHLLPAVAIYGANASGKTSVLRALNYMGWVVHESHRSWDPDAPITYLPFRLDSVTAKKPSVFQVEFVVGSTRYEYGFALNADKILEEWLYSFPEGRRRKLFTRDSSLENPFSFGKHLPGEKRVIQSITRPTSLFLSAGAQNNHELLSLVFRWFGRNLGFVHEENRSERSQATAELAGTGIEGREAVLDLLKAADVGVVDIEVRDQPLDKRFRRALAAVRREFEDADDTEDELPTKTLIVSLAHLCASEGEDARLEFGTESHGTQVLFALAAPILRSLQEGLVLCVDELDASLHPTLARMVLKLFCDRNTNPHGAQLIFNTHDTNLLDRDVLRRDQIWFTEKDAEGVSHLYPLTDFRPRKSENLQRGYLQGRYGAIPFLGTLSGLSAGSP